MGFRPDLDLGGIVEQYEVFREGESTAGVNYVSGSGRTDSDPRGQAHIPKHLYSNEPPELPDTPVRIGIGPLTCSSCTTVALSPGWCWDVNGYYASLGVHWRATRKELMKGYNARNGQNSVYLTYVLQQLLNKEVRAEYDACPLGEPYLNDMYVQDAIKREASKKAKERSAKGQYTTARQIIEEDYQFIPEGELDTTEGGGAGSNAPRRHKSSAWSYSYYAWRTHHRDGAVLGDWQSKLVSALSLRSTSTPVQFAVGFLGKQPHRYLYANVKGVHVLYLNADEAPTEELAHIAAQSLVEQLEPHRVEIEGIPHGTP